MILEKVVVSGSVGKQVRTASQPVRLMGVLLSPSGANATLKIRHCVAPTSGEIVLFARAPSAHGAKQFDFPEDGMRFDKGLHVTVVGTNAEAYLYLQ